MTKKVCLMGCHMPTTHRRGHSCGCMTHCALQATHGICLLKCKVDSQQYRLLNYMQVTTIVAG